MFDLASSCREIVAQLKSGGKRSSAPRGACAKTEKKNEHDSESASVLLAGSRREKKKQKNATEYPCCLIYLARKGKTD